MTLSGTKQGLNLIGANKNRKFNFYIKIILAYTVHVLNIILFKILCG